MYSSGSHSLYDGMSCIATICFATFFLNSVENSGFTLCL